MTASPVAGGGVAINVYLLEPMFPHVDNCCICDCEVVTKHWSPNYSIAMYEGIPVPPEWDGPWGGFTACKGCYDKNERGELERWTVEELAIVTANAARFRAALSNIEGARQ